MSHPSELEEAKRKRDDFDTGTIRGHARKRSNLGLSVQTPISGGSSPAASQHIQPSQLRQLDESPSSSINYLPRPNSERLALVPGDNQTFGDLIGLVGDYEAILERHESLAAALGAKLTGPLFLKRIEKFFEGPIRTSPVSPHPSPLSWLDVVAFAKSRPADFYLTTLPDGVRICQFALKGFQIEITEDDWRLISSGALDRFPLEHPFEEDETAELATLDILEQRTSTLYRKAEEVASRARMLHHKFGLRKHTINQRRNPQDAQARFQPINFSQRGSGSHSSYDLHADLLQQFIFNTSQLKQERPTSGAGVSTTNTAIPASPASHTHSHRHSGSGRSVGGQDGGQLVGIDAPTDVNRSLVTQKTEKLTKGDLIVPPCDRCRRLRLSCLKWLTACQGCTKKHAKCSWRSVTEDEVSKLKQEMGISTENEPSSFRNSLPPKFAEEGPASSATAGLLPSDIETSPDAGRGDSAAGTIYSPKTLLPGQVEPEFSFKRQSAGLGYEMMGQRRDHSNSEMDSRRASTIGTMPPSATASDPNAAFGGLLKPLREQD